MAVTGWDHGRTKTLTIAQSAQETDVLDMGSIGTRAAYRIGVLAPEVLTGVITIEVSDAATGPWRTLQSDNVDVALSADKATVLSPVPFPYIRFVSSLAEAAARSIVVIAHRN